MLMLYFFRTGVVPTELEDLKVALIWIPFPFGSVMLGLETAPTSLFIQSDESGKAFEYTVSHPEYVVIVPDVSTLLI
jgi:hypothetical protein